jgi:hypothetical protein
VKSSRSTNLKRVRPKLPKASEDMKAWSAALATEGGGWPQVTGRALFGFTALYRRANIFALLPRTRAMETANSLAFKLEAPSSRILEQMQKDPRIGSTRMQKARWFTFELNTSTDLRDALDWLGQAYVAATRTKKRN